VDEQSFTSLLQQLSAPFILMGDFNAYHPLWGSSKLNLKGQIVKNILLRENLLILKAKQPYLIILLLVHSPSTDLTFHSTRSWNLL